MSLHELQTYVRVIRRRLWLIILVVAAAVGTMLLISYLAKPSYRATAQFQVTAPLPAEVRLFEDFRTSSTRDELTYTKNNFMTVIKSEAVAWKVIEKLDLDMSAAELIAAVTLEPDDTSDFIKLTTTASDARMAAAISNTLLEVAAQYFGELNAGTLTSNRQFIQQQLDQTKRARDAAESQMLQFQLDNRIGTRDGMLNSQEDLINAAKANRDQALAEGRTAVAQAYDQIIATREAELQERIVLNAQLAALQQEVKRIDDVYSALMNTETEAALKENEVISARYIQVMPAYEPNRPLPRVSLPQLALVVVASLAVGVALAFLLEALAGIATTAPKMAAAVVEDGGLLGEKALG